MQAKKYCLSIKVKGCNKLKLQILLLVKPLKKIKTIENQWGKKTKVLGSLNFFNKINELKQAEDIFSDNQLTNLIKDVQLYYVFIT